MLQLPLCTLLAVLQGTGKRAMSPRGKGPPLCWTRASEKCAVSRAGQGGIPDGNSAFTSILYPPSVQNVTPLEEHCPLIIAGTILCHTLSMSFPPPCLWAQGQCKVSPGAKDRFCHPGQVPESCRSQEPLGALMQGSNHSFHCSALHFPALLLPCTPAH